MLSPLNYQEQRTEKQAEATQSNANSKKMQKPKSWLKRNKVKLFYT